MKKHRKTPKVISRDEELQKYTKGRLKHWYYTERHLNDIEVIQNVCSRMKRIKSIREYMRDYGISRDMPIYDEKTQNPYIRYGIPHKYMKYTEVAEEVYNSMKRHGELQKPTEIYYCPWEYIENTENRKKTLKDMWIAENILNSFSFGNEYTGMNSLIIKNTINTHINMKSIMNTLKGIEVPKNRQKKYESRLKCIEIHEKILKTASPSHILRNHIEEAKYIITIEDDIKDAYMQWKSMKDNKMIWMWQKYIERHIIPTSWCWSGQIQMSINTSNYIEDILTSLSKWKAVENALKDTEYDWFVC